jgi:hypothetical protein
MNGIGKWARRLLLAFTVLMGLGLFGLQRWIGTDDFRQRIEREGGAALGVPLRLGRVDVALWPLPALALSEIELRTTGPLKIERIELRPAWLELLAGKVSVATLVVRGAVLPQQGIDDLVASLQRVHRGHAAADGAGMAMALLPRRTVIDRLTWLDSAGKAMIIAAELRLDADALPRQLDVSLLRGRLQGARVGLRRTGHLDWAVSLQVAGGRVDGQVEFLPASRAGAEFGFKGRLQTHGVELSLLTAPEPTEAARLAQPLSGRMDAQTTLSARVRQPSSLLEGLQTQSRFTVHQAVLHGIDLGRAVKTVGVSRGGQTPLDTLAGQVTSRGKAIELQNLAASSGALSASGQVSIAANRNLSGRVSVDLGGAVGVPLLVGGTVSKPEVSLTAGAKVGAAIGTVLMPGIGTGAGASVGGKIGEGLNRLFGK